MKQPRGLRNNNPLNIRRTNTVWQGERTAQNDKEFVVFKSMEWGYRAAWRTLYTYYYRFISEKKPFSITSIIGRWAPPCENDTQAYIKRVASLSGIDKDEILLNPVNPNGVWKLSSIIGAMTVVENGIRRRNVDKKAIKQGYRLAFHVGYPFQSERPNTPQESIIWDEYWDWSPEAFGK